MEEAKKTLALIKNELRYPVNIKSFNKETKQSQIFNMHNLQTSELDDWRYYEQILDENHRIFLEDDILKIYDVVNQKVIFKTGSLPSGTYIYRLSTPLGSLAKQMIIVR